MLKEISKNITEKTSSWYHFIGSFISKVRRPLTGHYGSDALDGGLRKLESLILKGIPVFATISLIWVAFEDYDGDLYEIIEYWPQLLSLVVASLMLFSMCARFIPMFLAIWQGLTDREVMWHAFIAIPATIVIQGVIVVIAMKNPELEWLLTPANLWVRV